MEPVLTALGIMGWVALVLIAIVLTAVTIGSLWCFTFMDSVFPDTCERDWSEFAFIVALGLVAIAAWHLAFENIPL